MKLMEVLSEKGKERKKKQLAKKRKRELQLATEKAFHTAKLFLEFKNHDLTTYAYPRILDIKVLETHDEVHVRIPRGMNMDDVAKKLYVFTQYYNTANISFESDILTFVIRIYPLRRQSVAYDYPAFGVENIEMPVVAGMNRFNKYVMYSMVENPSLLVSGIMGSGKSQTLLQIIATLLLRHPDPRELELHMADLKGTEFHIFQDIQHVKGLCYTPDEFHGMMTRLHNELMRRSRLIRENRVNHINKLPASKRPPYLLLVVDEILVLHDGTKESKASLRLLNQYIALGRALGCYAILSIQRPCNQSLPTAIRGLLNIRMIHKVQDATNSEIAGVEGAEKIPRSKPGLMIYRKDSDDQQEVQAPFLKPEEAEKLLEPLKRKPTSGNQQTAVAAAPQYTPKQPTSAEETQIFGLLD